MSSFAARDTTGIFYATFSWAISYTLALAGWFQEAEDTLFSQAQDDLVNEPLEPSISQADEMSVSQTQDTIVVQSLPEPSTPLPVSSPEPPAQNLPYYAPESIYQ